MNDERLQDPIEIWPSSAVDLKKYIMIFWNYHKLVGSIILGVALYTVVSTLLSPRAYEARASFLVKSQGEGVGITSSLSSLGLLMPSSGGSLKDDLMDLLNSDALAGRIVEVVGPRKEWEGKNQKDARNIIKGMVKPQQPRTNLIEIRVRTYNPNLSADVANACVTALGSMYSDMGYTQASKKRKFIEEQLPKVSAELKTAEDRLKLYTSLSPKNYTSASLVTGVSSAPSIDVARLSREVEVQNAVYTILRKELETTKLEEAKTLDPFQLVDRAEVPQTSVSRGLIRKTMFSVLLSFMGGLGLALVLEWWNRQVALHP